MKKAYKSPTSVALELRAEAMIAASFTINNSGEETEQWTNKKESGWDCNDWSGSEEEE